MWFSFKLVHFLLFSLRKQKKKQKQDLEKDLSDPLSVMSVHATGQGCPVKETPDGPLLKTVNGPLCNGAQQIPSLRPGPSTSVPGPCPMLHRGVQAQPQPQPQPQGLCIPALLLSPPTPPHPRHSPLSGLVMPSASSGHPSLPPPPASSEGRTLVM